jgi:hypothetical protein
VQIGKSIDNIDAVNEVMQQGAKILYWIAMLWGLLVVLAYINLSKLDINMLMPIVLAGLVFLAQFKMSKLLSLLLLAFPVVNTINVMSQFDLNGEFSVVVSTFVLHTAYLGLFFYGCFKIIEGVFAYRRIKLELDFDSKSLLSH